MTSNNCGSTTAEVWVKEASLPWAHSTKAKEGKRGWKGGGKQTGKGVSHWSHLPQAKQKLLGRSHFGPGSHRTAPDSDGRKPAGLPQHWQPGVGFLPHLYGTAWKHGIGITSKAHWIQQEFKKTLIASYICCLSVPNTRNTYFDHALTAGITEGNFKHIFCMV